MKHTVPFLLACIAWLCTQAVPAQVRPVVVAGTIVNATEGTPRVVNIKPTDPTDLFRQVNSWMQDSLHFHASFPLAYGHQFIVNYGPNQFLLYAEPGDSLFLRIDAARLHGRPQEAVSVRGSHQEQNNQFLQAFPVLDFAPSRQRLSDSDSTLEAFAQAYKAEEKRLQTRLKEYETRHPLHPQVRQWLDHAIAGHLLNEANMGYLARHPDRHVAFYEEPSLRLLHPERLAYPVYPVFLYMYASHLCAADSLFRATADKYLKGQRALDILLKLPKNRTRDAMLAISTQLGRHFPVPPADAFADPAIHALLQESTGTEATRRHIALPYPEGGVCRLTNTQAPDTVRTPDFAAYLHQRHRGKVIYIDCWSTGCAPCILEHKAASKLHREYAGKDVVFVNLCQSSTLEATRQCIARNSIGGEHYLLDEATGHLFNEKLKLRGFPTYCVMDKTGRFASLQAPRPSETPRIRELLDRLLAE